MRKFGLKESMTLVLEILVVSVLLLLFWDFVMEEMFRFPNMTLFQACCAVVFLKGLRHWI